jgi:hypothetical protein
MARQFLFADECGNFDFSGKAEASKYFILVTVSVGNYGIGDALLSLRRALAWEGIGLDREIHATTDFQSVRDRVFQVLDPFAFRVDATILEKAKVRSIHTSDERFYKAAWWLHMRYLAPRIVRGDDELLVVSASLGTRRTRARFRSEVEDVVRQVSPTATYRVASWDVASEPCLQVADYCAWAIQRKWERADTRSHVLIAEKIASESLVVY